MKVVIINLDLVITNKVTIMDLVLQAINKYLDNIMVPFGKLFIYLCVCWLAEIWDIFIINYNKVLSVFTVIVD